VNDYKHEETKLFDRFSSLIQKRDSLGRNLVGARQEITAPFGWFRYKEAFSRDLVTDLLNELDVKEGCLLDPFAGVGTACFAAAEAGLSATAVEIMPLGVEIMETRRDATLYARDLTSSVLSWWADNQPWEESGEVISFPHLNLTSGQFSEEVERKIGRFLYNISSIRDETTRRVLRLALMDSLEPVSFALRDGQYLRKNAHLITRGGKLRKTIAPFSEMLVKRLRRMAFDLVNVNELTASSWSRITILNESSLDLLANPSSDLPGAPFSAVITSPPYLNRYDYTRNYALELALLGLSEFDVLGLRQRLLTCTVENREKSLHGPIVDEADKLLNEQHLFTMICADLERQKPKVLLIIILSPAWFVTTSES